jgi:Flp pilus assembly protein TadD
MKVDKMSSTTKSLTARSAICGMLWASMLATVVAGCSLRASDTAETSEASIHVAEAALNAGSPRVALQVAQTILNRSPDNVPALLIRGDALTQLAQNEDAGSAFQQALRHEPASLHAKLGLGRIRLTTDPNEAAGLFRDILRAEPTNTSAVTDLGIALDLLGQHQEAQTYYHRVLRDNPGSAPVRVNLALSLAMGGDSVGALRLIEPIARDHGASIKVRHNYAAILTMAGRRAEAADVLKTDLSPEEMNRALAAYKRGTEGATVVAAQSEIAATPIATPTPTAVAKAEPLTPPVPTQPAAVKLQAAVVALAPKTAATAEVRPTETIVVTQTSTPLTAGPVTSARVAATPMIAPAFEAPVPLAPAPAALLANVTPPLVAQAITAPAEMQSGPHVQLGAFASEAAAKGEWERLQQKLPDFLANRDPAVTTVERNGTTFWRLRTWGFADQSAARLFCSHVRTATPRCMVYGT